MYKNLKLILVAVLIIVIAVTASMFSGCRKSETIAADQKIEELDEAEEVSETEDVVAETVEEEKEEVSPREDSTIEVTDGAGNKISLEKPAEKVIVFAQSALEIINALGAMDKVVGVDNWSVQMGEPLAEGFEGFGDFQGLNVERIAEVNPDIIITLAGGPEDDYQRVMEFGIKVYIVEAHDFEGVYKEIESTGKIVGLENKALEIVDDLKTKVNDIYSKVSDLTGDKKPKVFYEVWNDPLMSAGKGTFINELIEKAGGINIVAEDGLDGWPEYSVEKLIENNPEIIIAPVSLAPTPEVILEDARFSSISAVINEKVYIVPDNPVSRPSQNIIKGLEMFAKAMHPEIFGKFEIIE